MAPTLAVSTVIFALRTDERSSAAIGARPQLWLPLVVRLRDPFDGRWALPGGPLREDEGLADAASRTLLETTGLRPNYLEQLYAFGDADRPGAEHGRVVSVVYWAMIGAEEAHLATTGQNVRWLAADRLPNLAFDHNRIVEYALWRLRTKVEYSRIAHAFLGETFTLRELREVHEVVLGKAVDPANFRRQVEASGAVVPTGQVRTGGRHRPAQLYRYDTAIEPVDLGPLAPEPQMSPTSTEETP
ncbi:NUDIX hydrolase [Occultella gossypii]|uniref:NUDIX hydrolase n=1 Tax=Occultella gossypii TaxID=2800820 RepID=A0ABS7S8H0_9MICO|nr:NUDIX domain-containing protein [Occultella gossypii]MBZ2196653.1 NUDIX hydrolase [Occultella gossypii]